MGRGTGPAKPGQPTETARWQSLPMEVPMIHSNAHDALVERGRSWTRDGVEIRNYADGRNRITARVGSDGVGLARTLGVVCPGSRSRLRSWHSSSCS
jgi:hypothetical protein